jgi:diguanylate cyclase (GGDEF)-like protein
MQRSGRFHWVCAVAWICLVVALQSGAVAATAPETATQLLKHADDIKTSDHSAFTQLLAQLDNDASGLSDTQKLYLRYLKAWQLAYLGDYAKAIPELNAVIDGSDDSTLRFRAGVTVVNVLAIATRYEEALTRLNQLLDLLPQVSDKFAREQGLGVAAVLYNQAGQYDLGTRYADKLLEEHATESSACKAGYLKLDAAYKSGKLQTVDNQLQDGINTCAQLGDPVFANLIRTFVANLDIEQGRTTEAIKLLQSNYDDVQRTHYPRLISEFDSILAQAFWKSDDLARGRQYAQSAIDKSVKNEITKPLVDAYRVLYLVAQKQGDYQDALAYHEKFASADKGYLNDTSARTLAYQMVTHQVQASKLQIDSLNKQNQVLQLQQALDRKAAETGRLYVALLLSLLGFIALWAYKTKRSQLRFKTLARRDGLTGIFNHQHFVEATKSALQYCAKSAREACVIVIDLDHFKLVNDTHGHAVGDTVLKRAVSACQTQLRSIDIFGRLGGEEFGIALPDCTLATASQRAEELRVAIAGLYGGDSGLDLTVSASFGVASTMTSGYDLRQLLIDADTALYDAKRKGRNRVATCQSRESTDAAVVPKTAGA